MGKDKSELEILFPEKKLKTNVGWVEIRPFSFKTLGQLSPILSDLGTAIRLEGSEVTVDFGVLMFILSRDECSSLKTLLKACSDLDQDERIDDLDADSTVLVISTIWTEVIQDFLSKVMEKVKPQAKTPLPDSSLPLQAQDSPLEKLSA